MRYYCYVSLSHHIVSCKFTMSKSLAEVNKNRITFVTCASSLPVASGEKFDASGVEHDSHLGLHHRVHMADR